MQVKIEDSNFSRVHIIKRKLNWAVKIEGAKRALKTYTTKEEAIKSSQKLIEKGHDLVIHEKDGSVERWIKSTKNI